MSILLFLVFGLVVGFLARAIMPGNQPMGIAATAALGVVGSLLGGFVASMAFGGGRWDEIHAAGLVGSVFGALAVMALAGFAMSRRAAV